MSQLSTALNQRKSRTLPNNTIQNSQNNSSCMEITTQSGKVLTSPSIGKAVIAKDIEHEETYPVKFEKLDDVIDNTPSNHQQVDELEKNKGKETKVMVTVLLKPPPFPHRLKNKADDTKFGKFMAML